MAICILYANDHMEVHISLSHTLLLGSKQHVLALYIQRAEIASIPVVHNMHNTTNVLVGYRNISHA